MADREVIHFLFWVQLVSRPSLPPRIQIEQVSETPSLDERHGLVSVVTTPRLCSVTVKAAPVCPDIAHLREREP